MLEEAKLSVGQVAKRCGIKVSTLHYYEQIGLLRSWRNAGNQRRYKHEVLRRVSVIKAAQKMGIDLESIKKAFASLPDNRTPTKKDWQLLSKRWQQQLNERIQYLITLRESLDGCIGCGCLSLKSCPIYNPEDIMGQQGDGPILLERNVEERINESN
ncbi:redox-sensitive transcriptional activator SoxR [Thalassotalea euphylliae]|uniref:redox-sensitive transcriptional activator SoxR n=1 Tax=Thalassotalea euphylliae TaxID=1655234 RepID=UPI00363CCFF1